MNKSKMQKHVTSEFVLNNEDEGVLKEIKEEEDDLKDSTASKVNSSINRSSLDADDFTNILLKNDDSYLASDKEIVESPRKARSIS